jgi:hypothetical protein
VEDTENDDDGEPQGKKQQVPEKGQAHCKFMGILPGMIDYSDSRLTID